MTATGYEKRSIQRLLKSLKDSEHYREIGSWYDLYPSHSLAGVEELKGLAVPSAALTATADPIDGDAIGEAVAKHVIDAADYMTNQLQNFEARLSEQIQRFTMFHTEHAPEPPPPDPVVENPLYGQLLDGGILAARAYALSKADLEMDEEIEPDPTRTTGVDVAPDGWEYGDNPGGRFERILDILHGVQASQFDLTSTRVLWTALESYERKYATKGEGETDAFELIYPAVIEAAKANVGRMTILEFLDKDKIEANQAPWDSESNPADKEDPALAVEIAQMLNALNLANDPRCEVHARTSEIGDDGETRTESLLGYHRRVKAKFNQMQQLQKMGVI